VIPLDERTEATFVADGDGGPTLVLWGDDPGPTPARVALVVPTGSQVRLRRVPARPVAVGAALDTLATLPADREVRPSVRAWSVATRIALDLVARGRLLPSVADDGTDRWRVGPLDADDHDRVGALVAALPAAAHCVPAGDARPRRIAAPGPTVRAFVDAVADALVRTAAAPVAAGHLPFAAPGPHPVGDWRDWLTATTAGGRAAAGAALRVVLPDDDDGAVECRLELRSRLDPGLVVSAADLWDAPAAVAARFGADVDTDLLLTLRRAARVWPPVGRLLDAARPDRLDLDHAEVEDLFGPVVDDLAAAGLPVLWPAEVLRPVETRPVVATPRPTAVAGSGLDLASLGELRWRATVDGVELTDDEITALAEAKRPMVRLRGRWVRADPERLRRLGERRPVRAGAALGAALSGSLTVDGEQVAAEVEGALADLAARLRGLGAGPGVGPGVGAGRTATAPPGLRATLRPYQARGVAWLAELADLGLGGVLADDMGLGKTVQVLGLHLSRRGHGPTLVVCPTTLLGNWEREAARFAPGVPVRRHHGASRALDALADDELVVTTYGVVRRDVDELAGVPWGLVVADEAQAVKNPWSAGARALRRLPARTRVALTGTPVENRLADLWALLDWTTPGLLGPLETFQRTVAVPVERDRDPDVTARLAATVRPFLLRRRKTDPGIAPDLPPKTETDRFVGLTAEQATLYRAVVAELLTEVSGAAGLDRRGLVLKLLTALKQICDHPAQYLGQDGPVAGRSGKVDAVVDLLRVVVDEGESALVFTQFVGLGTLLTPHLAQQGLGARFLHGGTPVAARQRLVDGFQAGEFPVLVVSLKAGGTGLNLTRATHVVHVDRWWNPAVEDQASDRAWRIGQDRPVQVHRMICEGTLEERIAALLDTKRTLAESVVGGGEARLTELSDAELAELVALGGGS
jgi:hypothetical protein